MSEDKAASLARLLGDRAYRLIREAENMGQVPSLLHLSLDYMPARVERIWGVLVVYDDQLPPDTVSLEVE